MGCRLTTDTSNTIVVVRLLSPLCKIEYIEYVCALSRSLRRTYDCMYEWYVLRKLCTVEEGSTYIRVHESAVRENHDVVSDIRRL
jgi:hypothetical protein